MKKKLSKKILALFQIHYNTIRVHIFVFYPFPIWIKARCEKNIVLEIDENEKDLIKKIYSIIKSLHDTDNALLMLEENDLPLKKIGKIIRKIIVNFESKIPIEKIILFFGIEKVKEKLLLYLNDWWKTI